MPLTDTVKDTVQVMAVKQGITKLKFTNKKGETLARHNWILGVDCDTINDDPHENENDEDIDKQRIDEISENNTAETTGRTNPTNGILVENVEENDEDMGHVIDEMIDALKNEVIPTGEDILHEMTKENEETM